ncbi:MAG: hypothetical protein WEE89_09500 [Gemmatimonadota bacterium]
MVPTLGDWCVVFLIEGRSVVRRAVTAHADPAHEPEMRKLRGMPVQTSVDHPFLPTG